MPYPPGNNLIKNEVILLPSGPEEYGSEAELAAEIQAYIHRYVDLSPQFERIASYYVLFSWLYDSFNELPYLRVRGDYGSGKTRFLLVVGSLCYKPVFTTGASTVSPIFHILDAFRGTLIIDEGDFRWSDDKAEIVKILNNGNNSGSPVLRSEVSRTGEFSPRAFQVYGPKIVATRNLYDDRALESRFITEETGSRGLRRDIPINLPACTKRRPSISATNSCCTDSETMERRLRPTLSWTRRSSPGSIRSLRHSSASSAIRPSEESSGRSHANAIGRSSPTAAWTSKRSSSR